MFRADPAERVRGERIVAQVLRRILFSKRNVFMRSGMKNNLRSLAFDQSLDDRRVADIDEMRSDF